jgi:glycosyltransferase involved in cell wall biosynthesis
MKRPLFSIVIPTYNRADFIIDTINSALAQDDDDFEVVVVDDGSTDNTEAAVLKTFRHLEKVRYYKQVNSERGAARNRGIAEARGRYVVFLDSDDRMRSNHLSALREIIEKRPGINFLATKYEFIRDGQISSAGLEGITEGEYGADFFLRGAPIGSVFCINKDNPDLKWFEEDRRYATSEDWMFLVQNLVKHKIYIGDKVTMTVDDHDQRSMRRDNQEVINRKLLAKDWIISNLSLSPNQIRILESHTYYFCAIHSYLDNRRRDAFRYLFNSVKRNGVNLSLGLLLTKTLLGYQLVQRIKGRVAGALPSG